MDTSVIILMKNAGDQFEKLIERFSDQKNLLKSSLQILASITSRGK